VVVPAPVVVEAIIKELGFQQTRDFESAELTTVVISQAVPMAEVQED
jgi:hypothetical protein